jgi:alpha-tubulin suppressor-like RCC1 family protein
MFITQEGHLYASGWNYHGQLGLKDNTTVFEKVSGSVVAVSCDIITHCL